MTNEGYIQEVSDFKVASEARLASAKSRASG
jgi:hypothetical protein